MENLTNSAIKCKTVRIYPEDAEDFMGNLKVIELLIEVG